VFVDDRAPAGFAGSSVEGMQGLDLFFLIRRGEIDEVAEDAIGTVSPSQGSTDHLTPFSFPKSTGGVAPAEATPFREGPRHYGQCRPHGDLSRGEAPGGRVGESE